MSKSFDKCPVCGSEDIKQELRDATYRSNRIGGSHTSFPPSLDGCSCNNCGTIFKFNKKGKCPICKGTGLMEYKNYSGVQLVSTSHEKCWGCSGTGKI